MAAEQWGVLRDSRGLDQFAHLTMPGNVRMPEIRVAGRALSLYLAILVIPSVSRNSFNQRWGFVISFTPPLSKSGSGSCPAKASGGLFDELYSTQIFYVQTLHELLLVFHCFHTKFTHGGLGVVLSRIGLDEVRLVQ